MQFWTHLASWYAQARQGYEDVPEEGQSILESFFPVAEKKRKRGAEEGEGGGNDSNVGKEGKDAKEAKGVKEKKKPKILEGVSLSARHIWEVLYDMTNVNPQLTGTDAEPFDASRFEESIVADKWVALPLVGRRKGDRGSVELFVCVEDKWFYVDPLSFGIMGSIQSTYLRRRLLEKSDQLPTFFGFFPLCVCRVAVNTEDQISLERAVTRFQTGDSTYSLLEDGAFFQTKTRLIYLPLERFEAINKPTVEDINMLIQSENTTNLVQYEDPYPVEVEDSILQSLAVEIAKKKISIYSVLLMEAAREYSIACGVCKVV